MTTPDDKQEKRSVVLDMRYQITFSLPMVLLSAALFAGLGHIAMSKVETATKVGINQIRQAGTAYLADPNQTIGALERRERDIRRAIILGGVGLTLGMFFFGLLITYRIARPLQRITLDLRRIADGSMILPTNPRYGGVLGDLYKSFLGLCAASHEREKASIEAWQRLVSVAEADAKLADNPALAELRARLREKEAKLG